MLRHDVWSLGMGALFATLGVACGADSGAEGDARVIRIGTLLQEGGDGTDEILAVREINQAGGISIDGESYQLELVRVQQGETAADGVAAVDNLIAHGAVATVGPRWSSVLLGESQDHSDGAAHTAVEQGFLLMSSNASSAQVTDLNDDDLVWRTCPSDNFQGIVAAEAAYANGAAKHASILYRDDVWGRGLADTFQAEFERLGGTVSEAVGYTPSSGLERYPFPELEQVFAAQPDVVYIIAFSEFSHITNRIVQGGYLAAYPSSPPRFLATDGTFDAFILDNAAPAVLERLSGTAPNPAPDDPDFLRYTEAYEAADLGDIADGWPYTYDAVYLIALAIQAAQSTDANVFKQKLRPVSGHDDGDTTIHVGEWQKAKEALLSGRDIDYQGASGPIDFTPRGDPSRGRFTIWKLRSDGKDGYEFDLTEGADFSVAP